jgi:hypothetical protein
LDEAFFAFWSLVLLSYFVELQGDFEVGGQKVGAKGLGCFGFGLFVLFFSSEVKQCGGFFGDALF